MARALAKAGQKVRVICNCLRPLQVDGVDYVPLDLIESMEADVLIANTSGGEYDLGPLAELPVEAGLTLVWMSGVDPPASLSQVKFDGVYAKSNFLLQLAQSTWGIPQEKIWVFYNGYEESLFSTSTIEPPRDAYRLVYASHPSKGLDTALDVTRRLRARDERFHLVVCGGEALWGRTERAWEPVPGVEYKGLIPQADVTRLLQSSTFSLVLQSRPEPFGMVVTESQRAGCIVVASPVGALPELVQDGLNGFIIRGDHQADATRQGAVGTILELASQPDKLRRMQDNARTVPWSTDLIARAWIEHWRARLDNWDPPHIPCPACGASGWRLADGVHCLNCRRYHFSANVHHGSPVQGSV
jgi:glycosyltransferase involved in cell wall biosynthesis